MAGAPAEVCIALLCAGGQEATYNGEFGSPCVDHNQYQWGPFYKMPEQLKTCCASDGSARMAATCEASELSSNTAGTVLMRVQKPGYWDTWMCPASYSIEWGLE